MDYDAIPKDIQDEPQILISNASRERARPDDEFVHANTPIPDGLNARCDNNPAPIDIYRSAVAPHCDIPEELLSEIFLHALSEPLAIPIHPSEMPWLAGRVCSRWRRVSIRTPRLWTQLYISCDLNHNQEKDEYWNHPMEAVLARSCSLPLSVRVSLPFPKPVTTLGVMLGHSHRLHHLTLDALPTLLVQFLTLPRGSIDALVELSISGYIMPELIERSTVLEGARSLRKLSWKTHCAVSAFFDLMPWSQLTHVVLPPLHPEVARAILHHCISLVECTVALDGNVADLNHITDVQSLTALPELRSLKVLDATPIPPPFLAHLDLPCLRHLETCPFFHYAPWDPASTWPVTRSGCLETLKIGCMVRSDVLSDLLEQTPALVSLELNNDDTVIPHSTLKRIASGAVLPRLRALKVSVNDNRSVTEHLDMVEERQATSNSATDIRTVLIAVLHACSQHDRISLRERTNKMSVGGRHIY